jgi:hypothetical protein
MIILTLDPNGRRMDDPKNENGVGYVRFYLLYMAYMPHVYIIYYI